MKSWRITRSEVLFLIFCGVVWFAVLSQLPPSLGATDTYLFRDAAWNLLAGRGFKTASFEHSHSFMPLLYSSYTPGSLWAFAAMARLLGTGPLLVHLYPLILALIADIVVIFAGLHFLPAGWGRRFFLALVGISLPFGFMPPMGDRPEPVSFIVLVLLVLAMRLRPGFTTAALAGLLAGAAFLSQPFAGVVAVLLIAGWLLLAGLWKDKKFSAAIAQAAVAALCFLLPVVITAGVFYHRDPQSLKRFWRQATVAGVTRQAGYTPGDFGSNESGMEANSAISASPSQSPLRKYKDVWSVHRGMGPIFFFRLIASALAALVWVLLLLLARGPWRGRCALLFAGFACLVFPFLVFPLQGNYQTLTVLLLPVLLAADWASVRTSLRSTAIIPVLFMVSALAALPPSAVALLMRWEGRNSYAQALRQVDVLRRYLKEHPLHGKVALIPSSHYYLYKNAAGNIYNPAYLSRQEDPAQVGAVVNCYAATNNFRPGTEPLLIFVAQRQWQRISTAQGVVEIRLFGKKLMSKNWGTECDIYVEADPTVSSIKTEQPPSPPL